MSDSLFQSGLGSCRVGVRRIATYIRSGVVVVVFAVAECVAPLSAHHSVHVLIANV